MNKKIIINSRISNQIKDKLKKENFEITFINEDPRFDYPVAAHPDMFIFRGKDYIIADEEKMDLLKDESSVYYDSFSSERIVYPEETKFNALSTVKGVIIREKSASKLIMEKADRIINVNQGYASCSALSVNGEAFITSDSSIFDACRANGLDVLMIRPGFIGIEKYKYGFIGGAGFYNNGKIFFFGNPEKHPDFLQMERFILSYGCDIVPLSDETLFDYGGAR